MIPGKIFAIKLFTPSIAAFKGSGSSGVVLNIPFVTKNSAGEADFSLLKKIMIFVFGSAAVSQDRHTCLSDDFFEMGGRPPVRRLRYYPENISYNEQSTQNLVFDLSDLPEILPGQAEEVVIKSRIPVY